MKLSKKICAIVMLFTIYLFKVNTCEAENKEEIIVKFEKNIKEDNKYAVYIWVLGTAEYPYPNPEDMINKMLGRRSAIIYAYKKLMTFVNTNLQEHITNNKINIRKDSFIEGVRIVNTSFMEKHAEVYLELPFSVTEDEYKKLERELKKAYTVKIVKNILKDYKDKIYNVDYSTFKIYIEHPDSRFVDLERYNKL